MIALALTLLLNGAHADLRAQIKAEFDNPDHEPVATVHLKVGRRTLDFGGTLEFVGLPALPDYFGLRDHSGTLHLFKADPDAIRVTLGTAQACAPLARGYNQLLECGADFERVSKTELAQGTLRAHGLGEVVDDVTYLEEKRPLVDFVIWGGSAVATMAYFVFLDAASELYVGRVGPRVLMDHLSSFLGSVTMVSSGVVFRSASVGRRRALAFGLATAATAIHFVIENPLALERLRAIRFNVADPADFWTGAVAAFGTAVVPETLAGLDHVRRWSGRLAQRRRCVRALEAQALGTRALNAP